MAKISKREKENKSKVEAQKFYALNEAVELVKALANAKFNESVDIAVQLGIDPRKSDQAVRGSVVMPAGTGKTGSCCSFRPGRCCRSCQRSRCRYRRYGRFGPRNQRRQDGFRRCDR